MDNAFIESPEVFKAVDTFLKTKPEIFIPGFV